MTDPTSSGSSLIGTCPQPGSATWRACGSLARARSASRGGRIRSLVPQATLVRLLDLGEISYARPGTHRRLKLSDVLAYQEERRRRFDDLHRAMAEEADAYEWTAEDYVEADAQLRKVRKEMARERERDRRQ